MNDEQLKYHLAYEANKIVDKKAEILRELGGLQHVVAYCIANGFYDGRIHQAASRLVEKDAELRGMEGAHLRLNARAATPEKKS